MDCFIHQDPHTGSTKIWCIEISSSTEVAVYFGRHANALQCRTIATTNPIREVRKRTNEKVGKGYIKRSGYIDDDNYFIATNETRSQPTPQPKETPDFDLSKLQSGSSFWF